ncbi:MAG: hypothetical protein RI940_353, partial [Bacteroidota bacterium]
KLKRHAPASEMFCAFVKLVNAKNKIANR